MNYYILLTTGRKVKLSNTLPSSTLLAGAKIFAGSLGGWVISTDAGGAISHHATLGQPAVPFQVALGNAKRRAAEAANHWRGNLIASRISA